jgi:hypothetical protein
MLLVAVPTVWLIYAIMIRLGLTRAHATLVTLTMVLNPLFLSLSFMFMSDIPGIFVLLLCVWSCFRALEAGEQRGAFRWLLFAAVTNVLGGTVRQIAWLGALVLVPCTAWAIARRNGKTSRTFMLANAALWLASTALIAAAMNWYKNQPYANVESLQGTMFGHFGGLKYYVKQFPRDEAGQLLLLAMFCLPVLLNFLFCLRDARQKAATLLAGIVFAVWVSVLCHSGWLAPFFPEVSLQGLMLPSIVGDHPGVYPYTAAFLLAGLIGASFAAMAFAASNARAASQERTGRSIARLLNSPFVLMLGPMLAAYMLLILTRTFVFDRYWLPVLLFTMAAMARLLQQRGKVRPAWPAVLAVFILGMFSVAAFHDLAQVGRARLAGREELLRSGVSPKQMYAGFEIDFWTELEVSGYLDDPRITRPVGAYHVPPPLLSAPPCVSEWIDSKLPSIHPRYELSYSPLPCLPVATQFAPVPYTTWLPPHNRQLYVLAFPTQAP